MRTFHHYTIAYREGICEEFKILENPEYGWAADPFLVEFEGEIYLFAEIFLYNTERNGKIGYCVYRDGQFGEWQIAMDKHWHLSYPNVFTHKGRLYMIPETYQLEEVCLYELISLPDKWKKVTTFLDNVHCCDSTLLEFEGKQYLFTFELREKKPGGDLYLYEIEGECVKNRQFITDHLEGARPGGKVIYENGKCFRVAQNCYPEYGTGLIFYEIDSVEPEYREHEVKRIGVKDINSEWTSRYKGVHTYNKLGNLEVIDLREAVQSEDEEAASDRVRKVFVNKYRKSVD